MLDKTATTPTIIHHARVISATTMQVIQHLLTRQPHIQNQPPPIDHLTDLIILMPLNQPFMGAKSSTITMVILVIIHHHRSPITQDQQEMVIITQDRLMVWDQSKLLHWLQLIMAQPRKQSTQTIQIIRELQHVLTTMPSIRHHMRQTNIRDHLTIDKQDHTEVMALHRGHQQPTTTDIVANITTELLVMPMDAEMGTKAALIMHTKPPTSQSLPLWLPFSLVLSIYRVYPNTNNS